MTLSRRTFLGTAAVATVLGTPMIKAQGRPHVVVIGGGAGGATAANRIAKNSNGKIDVTVIEPARTYHTCFFSNLYLGGFKTLNDIAHSYDKLAANGVNVVHDWVVGIDRDAKRATLANGDFIHYDKLILSPGIDFVDGAVKGWDISAQNLMPHAYKSGLQVEHLKAQLKAMPQGGTFALIAPPNPYRCPPAPYERVSMAAHYFKTHNPTAKIIVADPKSTFSKISLFQEGWADHYEGMIDWIGEDFGGGNVLVDPKAMTVTIDDEITKVDVCNVIPAMKAGRIAEIAGVTRGNWAPVHATDMSSKIDPNIYVLGDASQQGDMPKSASAANSQAKVCADAICGALTNSHIAPAEFFNTCLSLITTHNGVKIGATYKATSEKIARVSAFISEIGESAAVRKTTYEESEIWYSDITADMFG